MFSSRFDWDLTPNRLSEILQSKRASGKEVLDLTPSNPTCAGFTYDTPEVLHAIAQPRSMCYEPNPRGEWEARQAIASYYRSHAREVDPDSILLTASTSEAYAYMFKLLADPGDEILAPRPSYPLLEFLTGLESVHLAHYPLSYDERSGWRIDVGRLQASISDRTVAIVLVNPNNPTGSYVKRDELAAINQLCGAWGLALIVDEVFLDYGLAEDRGRIGTAAGNGEVLTFVLSGLSKVVGLPQLKLGWILVSGPEPLCAEAQMWLELIADTYLSVATPVQHAAGALLAQRDMIQRQIIARVEENGRFLQRRCAGLSACRVLAREGGWYAVVDLRGAMSDEEKAYQLLEEHDVFVHPGYFFDFPQEGFLVISLLTPSAIFRAGVSRMISSLRVTS